jgi:hypothetical protein
VPLDGVTAADITMLERKLAKVLGAPVADLLE